MMSSYNEDFVQKKMYPVMFMPEGPEKEEAVKKVFAEDAPKYLATLDKRLQNSKFLCGDKLSCYDFVVGGMWTNFVENPNNPGSAMMTEAIGAASSDRVKQYVADFKEELKDYLATRKPSQRAF